MKNTFLFLSLLVSFTLMNGQTTYPLTNYDTNVLHSGNYIKDTTGILDKFVGTWKYSNGSDEFTVKIIKKEHDDAFGLNDYYQDTLYGGYKYIKNGNLLIDRLNFTFNGYTDPNCPLMQGSNLSNNQNMITLVGNDRIVRKPVYMDLQIINPTTMEWKMTPRENISINGSSPTPGAGWGIPTNITLTKQ
ncbi:hypothetical protein J3D55_003523 [Chryseobacterium ginsenosidimutans]|uniref:DUF6705 family protein n=1 Tax=Chryseobacterium ginsenosidimutans TaxID=687846 RepID=UPI0021673DA2|nr:DUF6705 family protein [Chryseobacterium ginsenosidimutans]MCS3870607.1 hypothetical protein [Chryseobacterium ginsenosidimutans]